MVAGGGKMKDSFDKAIDFVLSIEGGYVNDPSDPGGETKYGISKRAYPTLDIQNLTESAAKEIYKRDYWDKLDCDNLFYSFDIVAFDTAVNMGVEATKKLIEENHTWQDLMLARIDRYIEISRKNATLQKFFRGWIIRCSKLSKLARG